MEEILGHSDNLSKAFQNPDLTATNAKYLAKSSMNTLQLMRSDNHFQLRWVTVKDEVHNLGLWNLPYQDVGKYLEKFRKVIPTFVTMKYVM